MNHKKKKAVELLREAVGGAENDRNTPLKSLGELSKALSVITDIKNLTKPHGVILTSTNQKLSALMK